MATPTETYYNIRKLNRVFALIALLGLGSIVWLVARNYTQGWRDYQRSAVQMDRMIVTQEIALTRDESLDRIEAVEQRIADARAELADNEAYQELLAERRVLEEKLARLEFEMQEIKALLDQDRLRLEQIRLIQPLVRAELEVTIRRNEAAYDQLLREYDATQRGLNDVNERVDRAEEHAGLTQAERDLIDARRNWDALQAEQIALADSWEKKIRNAPLIDFLAPTQEVKEVFLPQVEQNMIFSKVPATDRCMTCHVNIEDDKYTHEGLVQRLIYYLLDNEQDPETASDVNAWQLVDPRVQVEYYDAAEPRMQELWNELIGEAVWEGYPAARDWFEETYSEDVQQTVDQALAKAKVVPATGKPASDGGPDIGSRQVHATVDETLSGDARDAWDQVFLRSLTGGFRLASKKVLLRLGKDNPPERDRFARLLWQAGVLYFNLAPPTDVPHGVEPIRAQFTSLLEQVNAERTRQGEDAIGWSNALLAHPNLDLYVTPTSPHALTKMGCTVCHEGAGRETDFFYAAHTPSSELQHDVWASSSWEDYEASLASLPKEQREQRIKVAKYNGWKPHHWHAHHYWDRPMLPAANTQASCVKCHTDIYDVQAAAPRLSKGRELFSQAGCINCHQVAGLELDSHKVGPDLAHIADKLDQDWTGNWIRAPRDFRPSTRMPHFFRRPNNDDKGNIWRTEVEIQGMVDFLFKRSSKSRIEDFESGTRGLTADAENGRQLFSSVGCLGCHSNLDSQGDVWVRQAMVDHGMAEGRAAERVQQMNYDQKIAWLLANMPDRVNRFAPELSRIGSKARVDWLYGWLRDPTHFSSTTKMPSLRLTEQEALDLATYLSGLQEDEAAYQKSVRERLKVVYNATSTNDAALDLDKLEEAAFKSNVAELMRRYNEARKQGASVPSTDIKYLLLDEVSRTVAELLAGQFSRASAVDLLWLHPNLQDWEQLFLDDNGDVIDLTAMENREQMIDRIVALAGDPDGPAPAAIDADRLAALRTKMLQEVAPYWRGDSADLRKRILQRDYNEVSTESVRQLSRLYIGAKAINHYGCFGCHNVPGFENAARIGTELSDWGDKNIHKLDFAFFAPVYHGQVPDLMLRPESPEANQPPWAQLREVETPDRIGHTKLDWLFWKLRSPRVWDRGKTAKKPYELLKMPHFAFSEDEIQALQTFVISRREPLVAPALQDTTPGIESAIPRGRQIVRTFNCVGCHKVDNNEPSIAQTYRFLGGRVLPNAAWTSMLGQKAPPMLVGEGARVQGDWLFHFFDNVETMRPELVVRMPSFHQLSDKEKSDLVKFFVATVDKDRRRLEELLFDQDGNLRQQLSAGDMQKLRNVFAVPDNQLPQPDQLSATTRQQFAALAGEQGDDLYWQMMAAHFHRMYSVDYPFEGSPAAPADRTPAELAATASLIQAQCLTCHEFKGLPSSGNKGPRLDMTWRKNRRKWTGHWTIDALAAWPGAGNYPPVAMSVPPFAEEPLKKIRKAAPIANAVDPATRETLEAMIDYIYRYGPEAERAREHGIEAPLPTTQPD